MSISISVNHFKIEGYPRQTNKSFDTINRIQFLRTINGKKKTAGH